VVKIVALWPNKSVNLKSVLHRKLSVYRINVRKGKERRAYIYSAIDYESLVSKRSDMDHTVLPANTPYL